MKSTLLAKYKEHEEKELAPMAELRKLTNNGISELRTFLSAVQDDGSLKLPDVFLTDPLSSEGLPIKIEVTPQKLGSRLEAGKYMYGLLSAPEAAGLEDNCDLGVVVVLFL